MKVLTEISSIQIELDKMDTQILFDAMCALELYGKDRLYDSCVAPYNNLDAHELLNELKDIANKLGCETK